jgi:hypothetical protein
VKNKANIIMGWKLTKKGGAWKVKTNVCIYCACNSAHVEEPVSPCDSCHQNQRRDDMVTDDNTLYHYNIVDDDELAIAHTCTAYIMNMLGTVLDEITAASQISIGTPLHHQ